MKRNKGKRACSTDMFSLLDREEICVHRRAFHELSFQ